MILFTVVFSISCSKKSKLGDQVKEFYSHRVVIPLKKMDRRFCSIYSDTTQMNRKWHFYTYFDGADCQSCEIREIATIEHANRDKNSLLEFAYIVRTSKDDAEDVYRKFCNARIEGTLYLDTCNAFRISNQHFPDLKVFHAFVLDGSGRVLFVGNPFQNERMEGLFKKVIDKEMSSKKVEVAA